MWKSSVYRYYKSFSAIAKALGITRSAVSQWDELIPEGMAYKLESLTAGKLRVKKKLYAKVAA